MKSLSIALTMAALGFGLVSIAGCGGSGGGTATRSAQINLFATDSFREDFDHVWATILKVELVKQDGSTVTAFADANGVLLDLKTLRDATGARFSFLGAANVPDDAYKGIRVTIAPSLTLFPKGATTGTSTPVAASVPRDSQGNALLSLDFAAPRHVGNDDVVIDFDLASFVLSGGKVTPKCKEGGKNGIDNPGRHERDEFMGIVSGLSGSSPNFAFSIQRGSNAAVAVATDANTTIFASGGQSTVALANGQHVEVRGIFDTTTNVLKASSVKIETEQDHQNEDQAEVFGTPSNVNATGGTFTVTADHARGFIPAQTTVQVATGSSTQFRGANGMSTTSAAFFSALATAPGVEVEGSYDAATNTLTATSAKLETESEHHGGGDGGHHGGGGG